VRIPPRLNFVTLGVRDFDAMRAFYESLGWPTKFVDDHFVSFQIGTVILALYPIDRLGAEAAAEPPPPGTWSGWTLAYNVAARDEVDAAWQRWVDAGATPVNEPVDHPYGPRSGYVADPEGNRWEIAYADGVDVT
jgi:catechol 2,3-dioxygenase-like lactoylglutathione lyase family enzyme